VGRAIAVAGERVRGVQEYAAAGASRRGADYALLAVTAGK
jgi:hypothetical protein